MLNIGIAGLGFAGMLHAKAVAACVWQGSAPQVRLSAVADPRPGIADAVARRVPGVAALERGEDLAARSDVDAVVVATPNAHHLAVAVAALEAGKPVLVEKPLAASWDDACSLASAARQSAASVSVGYVFMHSPAITWAIEEVGRGAFGDILHIAITHAEDYAIAQGSGHGTWRSDPTLAGFGALGDLGAHALSMGVGLCGPVAKVAAIRGHFPGRATTTDDFVCTLLSFEGGASGTMTASRVAGGRKMHLGFQLHGTEGSLLFDHERPNEIQVFRKEDAGFSIHLLGPKHPHYAGFLPASGHGLGYADLFTIQMRLWVDSLVTGRQFATDLGFGMQVERLLHDVASADATGRWVSCTESQSK